MSRVSLAFFSFIVIGVVGGAAGVLLPSQIAFYHIDKTIIGFLFITFSTGYFLSAVSAGPLTQRLGQRWYLTGGIALFSFSNLLFSLAPPFVSLLIVNVLLGFGNAVIDAGFNAVITALPRSTQRLNTLHGFYGVGALLGPLIASTLLAIHWTWNSIYLIWCILSLPLACAAILLFRAQRVEIPISEKELHIPRNVLFSALGYAGVWLGALFLFIYVGIEVSIGDWSYSFLLEARSLEALLAGWAVSGYWLSLTLGRFLVNQLAARFRLDAITMLYGCMIGLGISTLLVWLLPGILPAIAGFCLAGLFLGPLFPTMIAIIPRLVPTHFVASVIGVLVGSSVIGGALLPWLVGTLAQSRGMWVLLPCVLILTLMMVLVWRLVVSLQGHYS